MYRLMQVCGNLYPEEGEEVKRESGYCIGQIDLFDLLSEKSKGESQDSREKLTEEPTANLEDKPKFITWGDTKHSYVICPYCQNDLMGGFKLNFEEKGVMCKFCGKQVDITKTVEREM